MQPTPSRLTQAKLNKYFENLPDFKERKIQGITTIILTLVAISFFGLFAISPTLSTISQLQKEIEDNIFIYDRMEKKISDLSLLQKKYADLQNDLPTIYSAIPKLPEAALLLAQIQDVASQTDVSVSRLQSEQIELVNAQPTTNTALPDNKQYSSYNFAITVVGTPTAISNFIISLVNFDRIVIIDRAAINRKTD